MTKMVFENGSRGFRAFIDCPAAGFRRELKSIAYLDGGVLTFPHDFSSAADPEQADKALPQFASAACEQTG